MPRTAYKAMSIQGDGTYKCLDFVYEIGKTYKHDGPIRACGAGFHCCPKPIDVYNYYTFGDNTEVMIVEIPDEAEVIEHDDKLCVNIIKVVGPVEDKSFNNGSDNKGYGNTGNWNTGYRNTGDGNTGDGNTGYRNTGDGNTGDGNTGYRNTGDWNTGNWNTGDWNTGNWNTGYRNTGDWNTGDGNTGYRNTGDWNTGDWNSSSYQTGFFNTIEQPVSLFNGRVTRPRDEIINHPGYQALLSVPLKLTKWIVNADLPDDEKVGEYTEGKQVPAGWLEAHKEWWANMSADNKALVQTLPGFCPDIFQEITGIDVRKDK